MSNREPDKPTHATAKLDECVIRTMTVKGVFVDAEHVADYVGLLEDLDQDAVIKAIRVLAANSKGMPDPAAVRKQIHGNSIPYAHTPAATREAEARRRQRQREAEPPANPVRVLKAMNTQRQMLGMPLLNSLDELVARA